MRRKFNTLICEKCEHFHYTIKNITGYNNYSHANYADHTTPYSYNNWCRDNEYNDFHTIITGFASCDMGAFHNVMFNYLSKFYNNVPTTKDVVEAIRHSTLKSKCPIRHCYLGSSEHNQILLDRLEECLESNNIDSKKIDSILYQFGEDLANLNR